MSSVIRSLLAVIVGFGLMRIAALVFTVLFAATFGLKNGSASAGYLATNTLLTLLAALIGGFVTAFMAADRPIAHAAALALLLFAIQIATYLHYTGQQPFWYQLFMQVVPPLFAIGGAVLFSRHVPSLSR